MFHLIQLRRRPLLAFPARREVRVSRCVAFYPGHTWKKRLVRELIRVLWRVRLGPHLWPAVKAPFASGLSQGLNECLEATSELLGSGPADVVVVWPAQADRGRVYLHFLDRDGRAVAFGKLALDVSNSDLIQREESALSFLARAPMTHFRVPARFASGSTKLGRFLVSEPLPSGVRPIDWTRCQPMDPVLRELAGEARHLSADQVRATTWWRAMHEAYGRNVMLFQALEQAVVGGVEVCRIHGDLNRTNVLVAGEDLWLVDWEQSHEAGPRRTDDVCRCLDVLWQRHRGMRGRFTVAFDISVRQHGGGGIPGDWLLAVAYLGLPGFTPALAVLEKWFGYRPD